ncbi:MAG: SAM-dependent methyltransferase [Mycobacteriales bacterium]
MDEELPSAARMYDYFLGGSHHFAVDRAAAKEVERAIPWIGEVYRANRAFLRRAVRCFLDEGVTQFLDLGSGIPTVGNVHEVARQVQPAARVVYVDIDPVAVAHSEALLEDVPDAAILRADVREPERILEHPTARAVLDFSRPVGLLMVGVLHFLHDRDHPYEHVAAYRDAVPPGSMIAVTHGTIDGRPEELTAASQAITTVYNHVDRPSVTRTHAEVLRFFDGFTLLEPGVVPVTSWRFDGATPWNGWFPVYAGVGKKD